MRFHHALAAVGLAAATCAAHADKYTFTYLGVDNEGSAYAVDDYGDYELKSFFPSLCGRNAEDCFLTVMTTGQTSYTPTPIALLDDPAPIAGAGCLAPNGPERLITCVNGHPIYLSYDDRDGFHRGLYDGNQTSDLIYQTSTIDGVWAESANGNLLYDNGHHDDLDLALDQTTLATAPTPEPSSFALLGSGLLGVAGMVRRRFSR